MVMTRNVAPACDPAPEGGGTLTGDVEALPRGARSRVRAHWTRVRAALDGAHEAGMATAEYAIATVAAAGFAGLLILILRSDEVRELLTGIVRGALST